MQGIPVKIKLGYVFGRLTVIGDSLIKKRRYLLCECSCGIKKKIRFDALRSGRTKSCGCLNRELSSIANTKHGMYKTRIYHTYKAMLQRCFNNRVKFYKNYGGRGVTVCKEWLDFMNFYNWAMSNGYKDHLTIERVNVNGNYEPSNCTFITMEEQKRNTTVTKRLLFNGKTMTMRQWSDEIGISISTLCGRFKNGLTIEQALTHKKNSRFDKYANL